MDCSRRALIVRVCVCVCVCVRVRVRERERLSGHVDGTGEQSRSSILCSISGLGLCVSTFRHSTLPPSQSSSLASYDGLMRENLALSSLSSRENGCGASETGSMRTERVIASSLGRRPPAEKTHILVPYPLDTESFFFSGTCRCRRSQPPNLDVVFNVHDLSIGHFFLSTSVREMGIEQTLIRTDAHKEWAEKTLTSPGCSEEDGRGDAAKVGLTYDSHGLRNADKLFQKRAHSKLKRGGKQAQFDFFARTAGAIVSEA